MAKKTMAQIHKGLKTMPACMKHMTSVMNMESGAARNRCTKLVKKNNRKGNSGANNKSTGY